MRPFISGDLFFQHECPQSLGLNASRREKLVLLCDEGDEMKLADLLLEDAEVWRHDEYPDLESWITLLRKLDGLLLALLSKFEDEILIPVHAREKQVHYENNVSAGKVSEMHASDFRGKVGEVRAEAAARLVSPHVATAGQAVRVIYSILHWFRALLEKSLNRYQFQSVDLVLACLRCFDDNVGASALEVCAQLCLEPFAHRDVLVYDVDSVFMHSPSANIAPLMDVVAASETRAVHECVTHHTRHEGCKRSSNSEDDHKIGGAVCMDIDVSGAADHRLDLEPEARLRLEREVCTSATMAAIGEPDRQAWETHVQELCLRIIPPSNKNRFGGNLGKASAAIDSVGEYSLILLWRMRFLRMAAEWRRLSRRTRSGPAEAIVRLVQQLTVD